MDLDLQRRCGQDVEETEDMKSGNGSREPFFDLEEFEESSPETFYYQSKILE